MAEKPIISFRISADIKEALQKLAAADRRSMSSYIELALRGPHRGEEEGGEEEMSKRLATNADDFTVNIIDDNGRLCLSIRFPSGQDRDAAREALQQMLDKAETVTRL